MIAISPRFTKSRNFSSISITLVPEMPTNYFVTFCLLALSTAINLCKQFRPKSVGHDLHLKCLSRIDTLIVFQIFFFGKS